MVRRFRFWLAALVMPSHNCGLYDFEEGVQVSPPPQPTWTTTTTSGDSPLTIITRSIVR